MGWKKPETRGGKRKVAEFITLQDVCELLKLSDRTVYGLCRQGKLPGAAKVGGRWRVDRAKLLTWLEAGGEVQQGDAEGNG